MERELLTIDEMAERLKVHKSWLYQFTRLRDEDTIPHLKVGKYLRFEEHKVMAWLKKRQANPGDNVGPVSCEG